MTVFVAEAAVGSYPTISPLPLRQKIRGHRFTNDLRLSWLDLPLSRVSARPSAAVAVYFLLRYLLPISTGRVPFDADTRALPGAVLFRARTFLRMSLKTCDDDSIHPCVLRSSYRPSQ